MEICSEYPVGCIYLRPMRGIWSIFYIQAPVRLWIILGNLELEARLLERVRSPLKAPANGGMTRTIHENTACRAYYRFRKGEYTFFSFKTDRASFEYELSK